MSGDFTLHGAPPLYEQVAVLDPVRHRECAFLPSDRPYRFAAAAPLIAVTIDEFARAALDYPIIFFAAEREAVVVTGLTADRNLFVAPDGSYAPGAYVPAYLRRHPFALAHRENGNRIVCIDEASDRLVALGTPGAVPLFKGSSPSEHIHQAIRFAEAIEAAEARTRSFVAMLDDLGLFEPRKAYHQPPGRPASERTLVVEYDAISRTKLDALDPVAFARLREGGLLSAIHAHWLSAGNWDVLPLWAAG